jgi:hypothetical protein
MAGNITDNWADFISTSISYFIIIILYAVIGADVIVLAKIFPATYIANNCGQTNLTYSDYIFPTDPENPPYGGSRSCPEEKGRKTQARLMTCNYTDTSDSTKTANILGKSSNPGIIWDFLQRLGMSDVSWPYTNLHKGGNNPTNNPSKERGEVGYWFNYTIANIVFEGFKTSRWVFKSLTTFLDIIPDSLLLILGPIFISIIIFVSNISALLGSYWGALSPLFGMGTGDVPNILVSWGFIGGGLILFTLMVALQGMHPEWFTTWWGTLINIIVMIIVMCLGGFVFILPAINTFVVILNTMLTFFYPLLAQNGKFLLNVLFCNKEFITLLYTAAVCIIAYEFLNNTLAYTMWAVWFVMVAIKLFQML